MERTAGLADARRAFGRYVIGPDELHRIAASIGVADPLSAGEPIPAVPFGSDRLTALAHDYLLLLAPPRGASGDPLTLNGMRAFWGTDPAVRQPCFYNQDWYLRESFAQDAGLEYGWYLIRRQVDDRSRGRDPENLLQDLGAGERFPSALLAAYAFFAWYVHTGGERLWDHSFVWCRDTDHNGDRIYVGRYSDPDGVNKNGFNIHRHLRIRPVYGAAVEMAGVS